MRFFIISLFTLVFTFLLISSIAYSQSIITANQILVDGKTISAGITPDSLVYGLDVAIDQLRLLLTLDSTTKAKLGLEIARERLLEVRETTSIEGVKRAQQEYSSVLDVVKSSIVGIRKLNSTQEISDVVDLEKDLEQHEDEAKTISQEIEIKAKVKGFTPQQQQILKSILDNIDNSGKKVKVEIETKRDKIKVEIKQETGKADKEIENEIENIEQTKNLSAIRTSKALDALEDARSALAEVKTKAAGTKIGAVDVLISESEKHLSNAEATFESGKYGEAFGQATAAEVAAKNAKKILEKFTEVERAELKITAEIKKDKTKVEVEVNGTESKFILDTINREEIISEIVSRTGLIKDQVESVIKIETEPEKKLEKPEKKEERKEEKVRETPNVTTNATNATMSTITPNATSNATNITTNATINGTSSNVTTNMTTNETTNRTSYSPGTLCSISLGAHPGCDSRTVGSAFICNSDGLFDTRGTHYCECTSTCQISFCPTDVCSTDCGSDPQCHGNIASWQKEYACDSNKYFDANGQNYCKCLSNCTSVFLQQYSPCSNGQTNGLCTTQCGADSGCHGRTPSSGYRCDASGNFASSGSNWCECDNKCKVQIS